MKFEYTLAELSTAITALEQVYGKVSVLDPYLGTVLDPATLQPTDKAEELTALDETGRGVQLAQADDGPELVLYQGIQADARPCVLAFHCCMPHNLQSSAGAENSFNRVLAQMQEELRRDYLTGVYNARYLDTEYRRYAEPQAQAGKPVGVVMARVNEYWNLLREEGTHAADCCLNTAAGILQLAAGPDQQNAVVRLEDGIFLVVSVGTPAAKLQAALHEALGESRRTFGITLSRRGEFTVSLSSADWGEAGSWDLMVALAEQRLSGC